MQTLFERYMAPEVAAILLNRQDVMQAVVGEVREIAVLFADIRNFTFLVCRCRWTHPISLPCLLPLKSKKDLRPCVPDGP